MRSLLAALLLAAPASAVMPGRDAKRDARRFGLDRVAPAADPGDPGREAREVDAFNRAHRGRWNLKFGPMGVGPGGDAGARLTAKEAADAFLRERGPGLGLMPDQLRLALARTNAGAHHLLFEQIVDGVPVEFASVKVHLEESGALLGYSSSFRKVRDVSPVPAVGEAAAAAVVAGELGGGPPQGGRLVFVPPPSGGPVRLAWKFRSASGGSWVYYVDARDGAVLLRYDDLRRQASCVSSGTVRGMVYDIDPGRQGPAVSRPLRNQRVYVQNASTSALTDAAGFFCSQTAGKIFTQLSGPFATVSNWNGAAAHYDNGGAVWTTFATPLQSAHPYAANSVSVATINAPGGALKVMPVFATLDVGEVVLEDIDLSITDNDQVQILDASDNLVATYIGQRSNIRGAAVPGSQARVRLKSNAAGNRNGYTISVSSYLSFPTGSPFNVSDNLTSTFTWGTGHTLDATLDEVNLFYHVNQMHDYFRNGPNASGAAGIDKPVAVMARAGPSLANAYYDPVQGNLTFGDLNSVFALDATVVHHEYSHFVVDQVMPIVNFGQHGAISEAVADYFSASSLELPSIGGFVGSQFSGEGSLRELDCAAKPPCRLFPAHWTGAIHDDSRMVSQALWELRAGLITTLGAANGKACADGLAFNALFYYPDSFADLLRALLAVSARSAAAVPVCGANNTHDGLIQARFSNHGIVIPAGDQDVYEPNDGIASATDLSTAASVSARIYPNADQDYYGFGAGPGRLTLTLTLPENPAAPGNYFAYAMTLVDRTFAVVAQGEPVLDVNPTLGGNCPESQCMTSRKTVTLAYDNPSAGQFFLLVSAPPGDESAVSNSNSALFYQLSASLPTAASQAGIVSASFDRDTISFAVNVATFPSGQPYSFDHARLRDHALGVIPDTETNGAAPWLTMLSSVAARGQITGQVRLTSGFASRFPAVGNVYLEVFGVSPLGHVQSLGFSNTLPLTANATSVKAFNNLFNPARGEKATVRWETQGAGRVSLRLYTVAGQHLLTLFDEDRPAGRGSADWYGVNAEGRRVASGVYILHAEGPGLDDTVKFVVVK